MGHESTSRFIRTLDPIHAMIYFAPEADAEYAGIGLESDMGMGYFASRAAAMGAVGAGVVTATFYNFNPQLVAANLPRAWSLASPDEVLAARLRAAGAALTRLLGEDVLGSAEVDEAADLAVRASAGCRPQGRPLYAAHADLDWPEPVHLRLWHAISLLREYRGDAHVVALQAAGLTGLEALITQVATGKGLVARYARRSRGWSKQAWADAHGALRDRGVLDGDDALTSHGTQLREEVEAETDRLSAGPAQALDDAQVARLVELGRSLRRRLAKGGAFPSRAFAAAR